MSGARACGQLHLAVSSYYYQPHGRRDATSVGASTSSMTSSPTAGLRLLTVYDDYTRECLWIEADISLSGSRVTRVLNYVSELRGRPSSILTDNNRKFAGLALERRTPDHKVQHRFIAPGKPSQIGYIESFNGKLRDGCLNEQEFIKLEHAKKV